MLPHGGGVSTRGGAGEGGGLSWSNNHRGGLDGGRWQRALSCMNIVRKKQICVLFFQVTWEHSEEVIST